MMRVSAEQPANLALQFSTQSSAARTVLLLASALACVAVAFLPFLIHRVKRNREPPEPVFGGTNVPYSPPERPRTYDWRLPFVALFSALVFVAAIWLPPKKAAPAQPPIALPAANAIGPGTGIYVSYADGSGGMGCTAGFLVHTSTGQAGVLTAGHCNRTGEESKVTMNSGTLPYVTVGTFSQTISEGLSGEQHDIGLIVLDGDNVQRTSAITSTLPVSGVTSELRIGQLLCKFGWRTGNAACGQITDVTESKVAFLATSQCGDSGGPVYLIQSDGTANAVGIHIRGGDLTNPNLGCSAPAKFSVAELVQPWLDKWNLTAVTAVPAPTQSAGPR
jgi:hypothetical protein